MNQTAATPDIEAAFSRADELARAGKLAEAEEIYRDLGARHRAQGKNDVAARCFRALLDLNPLDASAAYNLGNACGELGNRADAGRAYMRAIDLDPRNANAMNNLGSLLIAEGMREEAEKWLQRALEIQPDHVDALNNLGVLRLDSQPLEAGKLFKKAIGIRPDYHKAHRNMGKALLQLGRLEDAIIAYNNGSALLHQPGAGRMDGSGLFTKTSRCKLRHDAEQIEYLLAHDVIPREYAMVAANYRSLERGLPAEFADTDVVTFPANLRDQLRPVYNREIHKADGTALAGPAINPKLDTAAIQARYAATGPGVVHFDELLTPEALAKLYRYCVESTVWYEFKWVNGYVGAFMEDGFGCELIAQIGRELPKALPAIFKSHNLLKCWGFKYESGRREGIEAHADFAAVNVNFWVTPDSANLDPNSGGLRVWDKEAPLDWDFDTYNRNEKAILDFLEKEKAAEIVVPYRQNRALIFNSDLFHRTDEIRFKEGYENRRINITMLYGRRENA
jgi:Flp pilus assembly protein TadD